MTTQMSCSEKHKLEIGFNVRYFAGELKRSWPKMVLYFIMFALTMLIPLLMNDMGMTAYSSELFREENILRNSARLLSFITEYVQIWAPISMLVAIFAGCYVTKILNNRVSADFFHSTPMRRENIFLTRVLVGIITYLATFLLTVVTILILCETQTLAEGYGFLVFKQIMKNLGFSLLAFFMMFSITVFAGMLSGTTVMQLMMTAYLNLAVFVYYMSLFLTLDLFMNTFDAAYYIENESIINLVPFVRFFSFDFIKALTIPDICFYAIGSLFLLVGSLALYKFRRIEKAGTPIVFDGFSAFFRYSVIIPVTLLGGLFFEALVGSTLWYFIGLALGAVLCFMLVNTILLKNARKMFKGIRGFGIYACVMAVILCIIGFDVFGIDSYIPAIDNIKSVKVTLANEIVEIDFEDKAVIEKVIALDKSHEDVYDRTNVYYSEYSVDYYAEEKYYSTDTSNLFVTDSGEIYSFEVVYTPKSGFPVARRVYILQRSDEMTEFAMAVANSDEYEEYYRSGLAEVNYRDFNPTYDIITDYSGIRDNGYVLNGSVSIILSKLKSEYSGLDFEYFQRQQIGKLYFYGSYVNDYKSFRMPVFVDGGIIAESFRNDLTIDDYYSLLAEKITGIAICKGEVDMFTEDDAGVKIIEDKDQIIEILKNIASLTDDDNIFTEVDSEYQIGIRFITDSEKYYEDTQTRNFTAHFLKDKVPAFVADLFE